MSSTWQTAQANQVANHCKLSDAARGLLPSRQTAADFLSALLDAGLYPDALAFLAHWLPARFALWWGCLCFWAVHGTNCDATLEPVLTDIVGWIVRPDEPLRRKCAEHARKLTGATPLGALAFAVFMSEGSISPAGLPEVKAPPVAAPRSVQAAVTLLATTGDPEKFGREFLYMGADIVRGRNLWS